MSHPDPHQSPPTRPASSSPGIAGASIPKGPQRASLWLLSIAVLGLGIALFLPTLQQAMGLSYRRYRYRRYSSSPIVANIPKFTVEIASLSPAGRIDREKLRESIEQKLKRVAHCYGVMRHEAALQKKKIAATPPRGRTRKRKKVKSKRGEILGRIQLSLQLNSFGRSTSIQIQKNDMARRYHDCFVWYFRGRKFFAPQGRKSIKVRLALRVKRGAPKAKEDKKGSTYRRVRKAGGKW